MTETGTYVYAISRGRPDRMSEAMEGVGGVAGAQVRAVAHAGLTALVSTVGLAEFGEDALKRNLENLDWLESTARAHHAVVDGTAAVAVTLPLRLVTVYRNDERVREVLSERGEEFTEALDRITGRTEWGVKGYADPAAFTSAGAGPGDAGRGDTARGDTGRGDTRHGDTGASSPGTAYLQRRRAQQRTDKDAREEAAACADRIDYELCEIAATSRVHPPQDPQLSGHEGWMILNAAYLVDDERAEDFRAAVTRLSGLRAGLRLELTGPWAPYSFAEEPTGEAAETEAAEEGTEEEEGPWTGS
ncbi:GvpL/GvpF family gas vesicle protein [Actinomadura alba]|uniref:GvpL/GvpF family gas vesicle protein n=1 Tax=Actinomadura alba TaxID=406431 RepID=A0ABR7LXX9_9ACTN|nr:GvpL/GvpF family gas vesicle protein [Actinomadura alba]MBC6469548.1 GvpL/GvpF family gas vesicle protein [Actinomadura alba]